MTKINLRLKQNINLLALVPLALLSGAFFIFAYKFQSLPKTSSEPQTITVSNDISGTDFKLYRNKEYGFSFTYPKNMVYKSPPGSSTWISFFEEDEAKKLSNARVLVYVRNREFKNESLYAYLRLVIAGIQNYLDIYSIEPYVSASGASGYEVRWNTMLKDNPPLIQVSRPYLYFDLSPKTGKVLVISSDMETGSLHDAYETMVSTLKITD